MRRLIHISTLFILIIGVTSCDQIKNKTEKVTTKIKEKAKNKLRVQTQKVIDKVAPTFDHDKPDTENNRKRFSDFLKVEITPDVKNIYCFDDVIGIDADYMFAFNCNETTSQKIIEYHHLSIDSLNTNNGFSMQNDFEWWDKDRIENLQKYSWTNGNQYFKYYWYDSENGKAYFFDFDR
ncbi:hypothetical protein [Flammeovirga sp. EKP202]|uniref:hypothetical protein n=1 Tax=Flammeovirga sp. EKP202 TaxID=2770592 RepID=UPI001CB84414|nr:hypothetical protein [Flammeovirga sp. EKP202]